MAKVDVKLSHESLVNGRILPAGTIVEMDPKIAAAFGEVQKIDVVPAVEPVHQQPNKTTKRAKKRED